MMFCMQCSQITNHFDYFIRRFWIIKLSFADSPFIKRFPPWSVSIRLSTSLLIRCFSWGLFFGHESMICLSFTPQKMYPLVPLVNTIVTNTFLRFVTVLPRLESWSRIGSPDETLIPQYLLIKQHNYPIS